MHTATYLVTAKPAAHNTYTATVTRYGATGLGRVLTVARGRTMREAVSQARRDVRTARHCGGVR